MRVINMSFGGDFMSGLAVLGRKVFDVFCMF